MDIYQICLDEVALEGLDGITISTLWLRLNSREEKIEVTLSPILKEILWKFLLQHSCIEFFQIASDRSDPVIFNRYLGIDVATGKHVAIAPDELDIMQNIYYVKPVSNQPNVRGSCLEFDTRINVTTQLRDEDMSLGTAMERYGEQQLVIVASQRMRESVMRGPGVTAQTLESLTDIEYCILERIGRSRWQGELQTVLNNYVFKQLKSAHIHYMMKSLFQKGLITKQPYSYVRDDKNGKVYQQILLHLPHLKTDARSVSDIRAETICEMLKQTENQSILCNDLRQIISVEGKTFRKLLAKMVAAGFVKVENLGTSKHGNRLMTLIKTPAEKQDEEIMDDPLEEEAENDIETGLIAELPLTLQGYRHIFSTGENGCSQGDLNRRLKGYGSLEARHLCRKVEKAKIVKIIMIDHGKQRTQKYIADNFARDSLHTKQFFEEQKKMKKILKTTDPATSNESSMQDDGDTSVVATDDNNTRDGRLSSNADGDNVNPDPDDVTQAIPAPADSEATAEVRSDMQSSLNDNEMPIEADQDPSTKRSKWDTHQTTRKMRRTNTILSYINEQKIVEGFFALQKILQGEEKDEGLTTKVCKKTVKRLVQKLHNDALIKYFSIPLTSNDCTVEVDFVMSLDCDSLRLKTAVEQAQFKKYSEDSKKIALDQAGVIDLTSPTFLSSGLHSAMNLTDMVKTEDWKQNNKLQYGYQPKFLRNQVVHEYLWYLAYGHPFNGKENFEMFNYDKIREYSIERNWKRFLPPAPCHPSFGPGWLQVGDAAVLLPLTILCQYHQYSYKIDGLEQYIGDPTQKNSLVRHLPIKMRGLMFHKRKYLFSLIQVIENLCFMGLVTFNKQRKNVNMRTRKESEMIYIHRNVTVADTRKSQKGYSEVSEGITYEKMQFKLDNFSDVEKYWTTLKDVSLMTPLGVRGNEETDPEPGTRHAVKMKTFIADHVARERWEPTDEGTIPGDQRGAGGLDSSLFSHLYRNWYRPVKVTKNVENDFPERLSTDTNKEKPRRLPKLVPTVLTLTEENAKKLKRRPRQSDPGSRKRTSAYNTNFSSKKQRVQDGVVIIDDEDSNNKDTLGYEVVTESNVGRNHRVKGGRGRKRPAIDLPPNLKQKRRRKRELIKEHVKPKRKEKYTDSLDLKALSKRNGRIRVSFSTTEDEVLLMARIASTLLTNTVHIKRKPHAPNAVSGIMIRDLLHSNCPEADNKTSYSVLKRTRVLMKTTNAVMYHGVTITEIENDEICMNELFNGYQNRELTDSEEVCSLFNKVYHEVSQRFRGHKTPNVISLPDTIREIDRLYVTKVFATSKEPKCSRILGEVNEPSDIELAVLENLIYVTLSLNEDEFSQFQAYKIFEKYPPNLIAEVWQHVRVSGIICKKPDMYLNRQRHLPFAVSVFHLSKTHFQYLQAGTMWKIFSELSSTLNSLTSSKPLVCDMNTTCGAVIIANMLFLDEKGNYEAICPDVTLDPEEVTSNQTGPSKSQDTNGENIVSLNDVDDDDDEEKGKAEVKELFHLYRRKRFAECIRNDKSKSLQPVIIRNKSDSVDMYNETSVLSDVDCVIKNLDSVKLPVDNDVILLEDSETSSELKDAVRGIAEENPVLRHYLEQILTTVDEAGVAGISLSDLNKKLHKNSSLHSSDEVVSATINLLKERKVIYSVGMWHERAVSRQHAYKWFVEGTVFKGDRSFLRNEIRKELSETTSRYQHFAANPSGHKWNEEVYAVYKNSISINPNSGLPPSSSSDAANSTSTDLITKNDAKTTSSSNVASWILSDASNYERVRFLCRPWHNISGEVNHRTAKLLLTGVFVHILWHPGVALRKLTEQFIAIMQRVAMIELLEKLVLGKCIERHKIRRHKPWQLFTEVEDDVIDNVTSDDTDYYRVAPDGMLRMTALCRELDKLQEKRNSSLAIPSDPNQAIL